MARKKTSVEYSDFTRGIITEASPLTFPDNASLDEQNVNINRDGSRQRRFGMDWQDSATAMTDTPLSTTGEAVASYTWRSAGHDGDANIGVVQRGRDLLFFDLESETVDTLVFTYTFTTGQVPSPKHQSRFQFTSAYGKLIVSVDHTSVYVFKWNPTVPSATLDDTITLSIRDRFGVVDGLDVDERPVTLSDAHNYNLRNQGWPWSMRLADNDDVAGQPNSTATEGDPIARCFTDLGYYPANSDLVWAVKMENLGGATGYIDSLGAFDANELTKIHFGTTSAPKGRYVIDLFARGPARQTASTITPLPTDTTTGGISTVASFSGRLWYGITETSITGADARSPALGSMVFFSQLSEKTENWGACHAANDPTTEDFSDPLPTDGGYISIPDLGKVYKMVPLGESMFILSSNGVWEVFGGDAGFTAQDQTVVKVTDVGPISSDSVVQGENVIAYWSESGIYAINIDSASLRGTASNITEQSIQSIYDDISLHQKGLAVGHYDFLNKQVMWLYNTEDKDGNYYYDRELILDTLKGGFTRRTYSTIDKTGASGPYLCGYLGLRSVIPSVTGVPVTAGGVTVTAGGVVVTVARSSAEQRTKSSTLYLTAYADTSINETLRIAGLTNFTFYDWPRIADDLGVYGSDAEAYLITGAITGGDTKINKMLPYVHVRAKRTETDWYETVSEGVVLLGESSILMSAQWDWTNDPTSGRWSRASQVYRLPRMIVLNPTHIFAYDVVTTRNKIRGKGKAVSLKFASEPGKDLYLHGWGLEVLVD